MNRVQKFIYDSVLPAVGRLLIRQNRYCNVIYYHDVVKGQGDSFMHINEKSFKQHMQWLVDKGYETLRFDDLNDPQKLKFKRKRVLIAFDDGWLSNYNEIYSWMKERNIIYSVFLAVGEIGSNPEYLSWDMVREMHESGLCGFGAHTYTHPDMSDLSKIDFNLEVLKADEIFEKELGYKPLDFCYPFGYYTEDSNKVLIEKTGYSRIYTSKVMCSYPQCGKVIFGRNAIRDGENVSSLKLKAEGVENIYTKLFNITSVH